jgi:hypothetical protein
VSTNPALALPPIPEIPLTAASLIGAERPMEKLTEQDDIRAGLKEIYRPGDVIEVRAFHPVGYREVGRFELGWKLVKAVERANVNGADVYYVLNPTSLKPQPMTPGSTGTKETDVARRRHFLLDFDPIRDYKIATEAQFQAARLQATKARDFIEHCSGVRAVMASSGNGVHLLVPMCELPNDDITKEAIRRAQRSVAAKFNTPEVECECFPDAARLVRAYGSLNKKGRETETLKWRKSGLL